MEAFYSVLFLQVYENPLAGLVQGTNKKDRGTVIVALFALWELRRGGGEKM